MVATKTFKQIWLDTCEFPRGFINGSFIFVFGLLIAITYVSIKRFLTGWR